MDQLFINPYVTVARAAELLQVTQPTASKAINSLINVDLLRESTGRTWGRVFVAKPILDIIENPK